jgi:hypothetical protein
MTTRGTNPAAQLIDPPRFYTTRQVCEILACSRDYLYKNILATRTLHPIRRGSGSSPNLFFSVEVDKLVRKLAKEAGAV